MAEPTDKYKAQQNLNAGERKRKESDPLQHQDSLSDPFIGQIIDTKYKILAATGSGGMGTIYKAQNQENGQLVAIKMTLGRQPELGQARLKKEALAMMKIRHPNVAAVYDFGFVSAGQPYMVMEYLEGVSLFDLIRQRGHLEEKEALDIFLQVSAGLAVAHKRGIIHRDLSPGNIMLISKDRSYIAKILDFGLAKSTAIEPNEMPLTKSGELFGTPTYMSPEQCSGIPLDARSDIYSFGCVMYEALTGVQPFAGESLLQVMHKHFAERPKRFKEVSPDGNVSQQLEDVVLKTLEKLPEKRVSSAFALHCLLTDILERRPTRHRWQWQDFHKGVTIASLIALGAAACYLLYTYVIPRTIPILSNNTLLSRHVSPHTVAALTKNPAWSVDAERKREHDNWNTKLLEDKTGKLKQLADDEFACRRQIAQLKMQGTEQQLYERLSELGKILNKEGQSADRVDTLLQAEAHLMHSSEAVPIQEAYLFNDLAMGCRSIHQYTESIQWANKALAVATPSSLGRESNMVQGVARYIMALTHMDQSNNLEADQDFKAAIRLLEHAPHRPSWLNGVISDMERNRTILQSHR